MRKFSLFLLLLIALGSCREETLFDKQKGDETVPTYVAEFELFAALDDNMAEAGLNGASAPKKAVVIEKGKNPLSFLKSEGKEAFQVWNGSEFVSQTLDYVMANLFFFKEGEAAPYNVENVVKIPFKNEANSSVLVPCKVQVNLPQGVTNKSALWVSALINGGTTTLDSQPTMGASNSDNTIDDEFYIKDNLNGQKAELKVPFTAPWKRVVSGRVMVDFKPRGVVLSLRFLSGLYKSVFLQKLFCESENLSRKGSFSPLAMSATEILNGNDIKYTPQSGERRKVESEQDGVYIFRHDGTSGVNWQENFITSGGLSLEAGQIAKSDVNHQKGDGIFFYYAGIPVDTEHTKKSKMWVSVRGNADVKYEGETEQYGDYDFISNQYSIKQLYDIKWKDGAIYPIDLKVASDLMITEDYHTNKSMNVLETNRYLGILELYNPTCDTLDLREYGLVRLCVEESYGGWLANFFPVWDSGIQGSATILNSGMQDVSRIDYNNLRNAMIYPLVKSNHNFGFCQFDGNWDGNRDEQYWANQLGRLTWDTDHGYFLNHPSSSNYQLLPGQTMLIYGAGFAQRFETPGSFMHGANHINAPINQFISRAQNNDHDQSVLAFQIVEVQAANPQGIPYSANSKDFRSGVTAADRFDSYILIRKRTGQTVPEIIDCSGTNPLTTEISDGNGMWPDDKSYLGNFITKCLGNRNAGWNLRTRRQAVVFPTPKFMAGCWVYHYYGDGKNYSSDKTNGKFANSMGVVHFDQNNGAPDYRVDIHKNYPAR